MERVMKPGYLWILVVLVVALLASIMTYTSQSLSPSTWAAKAPLERIVVQEHDSGWSLIESRFAPEDQAALDVGKLETILEKRPVSKLNGNTQDFHVVKTGEEVYLPVHYNQWLHDEGQPLSTKFLKWIGLQLQHAG